MKTSELVKELMNHLLTYGDREVITAQKDEDADYTYGTITTGIVDYGNGTIIIPDIGTPLREAAKKLADGVNSALASLKKDSE